MQLELPASSLPFAPAIPVPAASSSLKCGWGRCNGCNSCGFFVNGHVDPNKCSFCTCDFRDHE